MAQQDFDVILIKLGTGRWNLLYFVGVSSCTFWIPSIIIAGTYVTPTLDFSCDPDQSFSDVSIIKNCTFFTGSNDTAMVEHKCTKWIYNQSESSNSLTSEFNLVCDRAYLKPTYQTAYMIGNIMGSPINGYLSDRFGRKVIIIITSILGIVSVVTSFAFRHITLILFTRFMTGVCFHSMLLTLFTLFMEVCEPKYRSTAGVYFSLPWAFGTMWWGFLGYMIRDWRWLQGACIIPTVILFVCLCLYDESPRWLIVHGKHQQALKCLKRAARWNRATLPPDSDLKETMNNIQESSIIALSSTKTPEARNFCMNRIVNTLRIFITLLKTSELRRITLLMYSTFFVSGLVYYGLSLNADNFKLDPYIYIVVVGATQIPAYTFTGHLIEKFGRVPLLVVTFVICGITIFILVFIPSEPMYVVYIFAFTGACCIAAAFQIVFLVATEVFPTEVRQQAFGTASFLSSVGGGIAPFITQGLALYPWVPSLVFGLMSFAAGVASFFIPETLNRHMPETIEQLEQTAKTKRASSSTPYSSCKT